MKKRNLVFIVTIILCSVSFGAQSAWAQNWIQKIDSASVYSMTEHNGALYAITPELIYKSPDAGETWQPAGGQPHLTDELNRIFAHGAFVYVGTFGDGVFRSNDGGQSWQSLSDGLPAGGGGGIFGFAAAGTNRGVYRGTLGAQNWQRVDIMEFPNEDIVALAAYQSTLIAGLFYGGQHWIFTTNDAGLTWDFRAHELAGLFDLFSPAAACERTLRIQNTGRRISSRKEDALYEIGVTMTPPIYRVKKIEIIAPYMLKVHFDDGTLQWKPIMKNIKCHICGSENFEERRVEYIYGRRGKYFIVPDVPCEVCLNCGERYYPAEALLAIEARFEAIHEKQREPEKTLAVPVESFAALAA